jgi:hypothetical protein
MGFEFPCERTLTSPIAQQLMTSNEDIRATLEEEHAEDEFPEFGSIHISSQRISGFE